MNISYDNKMKMAFDKPLEYKGVLLYPATLLYYSIFACADECLDVSRMDERDIRLLRLPYLEYIYEKSLIDTNFKNKWDMLICILNIVFGEEQPFDILKEDGRLCIKVYQRSANYKGLEKEYNELKEKYVKGELGDINVQKVATQLQTIQEKMYNHIIINSNEFDDIRNLIMLQNDIKPEHYDKKTEEFLYQMKEKLRAARKTDNTDLEDLITIVAYSTHKDNSEMEGMTIRRFNRFLQIALSKDDYYMYKKLELSGMIKMKSDIPHWIRHYEPKGKFDDILVSGNSLMSSLQDGGKI